jgi:hypothetical protein
VQNFLVFFLPDWLSTCGMAFIPVHVSIYLLIISMISSLSTILFSGAKLISLYFFPAKKRENLIEKPIFYAKYPQSGRGVAG